MPIQNDLTGWNSWPTGPLRSGPMLGEAGETDAFVWAQGTGPSPLTLTLTGPNQFSAQFVAQPVLAEAWCVVFHVTGLAPGMAYSYTISSPVANLPTPVYQLRAGPAKSARRARIAFGSCCANYWLPTAIFQSIQADHPDAFVMAGDNSYFLSNDQKSPGQPDPGTAPDWANEERMMLAHFRQRNSDSSRALAPNVSVLGIWDDHDFGPNDSGSVWGNQKSLEPPYTNRNLSLSAFKRMWAQRSYGTANLAGVFSTVRCGPVEIFLTDGRYHRVEKNSILGAPQLDWLKAQLVSSTAPVKLIVSGSVVLPQFVKTIEGGSWEGWERDAATNPTELATLLSHIEAEGITGVVFASGDLHLGYLMHRPGSTLAAGKQGPDYWEVVSSPLQNSIWGTGNGQTTVIHGPGAPVYDPYLLEEVMTQNYGLIDVDLDRSGKELILSLKNSNGATCFAQPVTLGSLKARPAARKRSALVWNNGKTYFFRDDRYARYTMDASSEGVDQGYPAPLNAKRNGKELWPGLSEIFPRDIDAAVAWPNNHAYFFKGNGYVKYSMNPLTEGVVDGYPKYISEGWKGLWPSGIDAAVVWNSQKAYFFKGTEYVRYNIDPAHEGVDPDYPRPIKGNWPGLAEAFPDGIDAALVWPTGKAYFFKGDMYVRYTMDPAHEGVDPDYPRPIKGNWKGLESL